MSKYIKMNTQNTKVVKNKNKIIRSFLKRGKLKIGDIFENDLVRIKKLNTSELNTNYYLLKTKKENKTFFVKETNNKKLIELGNHGYNEYKALTDKKIIEISKLYGFEVIEPYIGFIDYSRNKSYIVTPYLEYKTIDKAYSDKLISKKKYLKYRELLTYLENHLKKENLKIGDISTHNVFIDTKNPNKKPIIFDPWYIPKKEKN